MLSWIKDLSHVLTLGFQVEFYTATKLNRNFSFKHPTKKDKLVLKPINAYFNKTQLKNCKHIITSLDCSTLVTKLLILKNK